MTRAKIEPVTVARTQKRNPSRAAAEAASSSSIRRVLRYLHEYQAATKKARVETQACGTWKKTMREDSPTKFWAGRAKRNAPQQIAAIPRPRNHLAMRPKLFTEGIITPILPLPTGALASETRFQNRNVSPSRPLFCVVVSSTSCSPVTRTENARERLNIPERLYRFDEGRLTTVSPPESVS